MSTALYPRLHGGLPPWLVVPVIRSCQSLIWIWLVNHLHLHLHLHLHMKHARRERHFVRTSFGRTCSCTKTAQPHNYWRLERYEPDAAWHECLVL